jgi:hypothetical protein
MGKALDLLATGAVRVTWTDGWSTRAFVRDPANTIVKVTYKQGRWLCERCGGYGCSHTASVAGVVRVL